MKDSIGLTLIYDRDRDAYVEEIICPECGKTIRSTVPRELLFEAGKAAEREEPCQETLE